MMLFFLFNVLLHKVGWSALSEACIYGHLSVVEYLIANGAQINSAREVSGVRKLSQRNVKCAFVELLLLRTIVISVISLNVIILFI